MHKKIPKICTGCRVSAAKIYLYHSTKIAKAKPHRVVSYRQFCPEAVVQWGAMINIHKRLSTIVAMIINHCFCLGTD